MNLFPIGDSHVHPDYSPDATGSLVEYCQKALEIGLVEITFMTHYEMTPNLVDRLGLMIIDGKPVKITPDVVQRYIDDVRAIGEEFFQYGLKVNVGLEFGWDERYADRMAKEIPQYDVDLLIGAVHEIDDLCFLEHDQGPLFFQDRKIEDWIAEYFKRAEQIAESDLFQLIAHLDAYKKYGFAVYGDKLKTAHEPYIDSLFKKMHKHQLGLELNTSGMRHGVEQYYPSIDILNTARRAGVHVVALGSDAHHPDQMALDFETAVSFVHELLPLKFEEGNEY